MPALVEVAVAVLVRADGAVLLARRPAGKVYAGYWEFPGGKVESGEAVPAALAREIREELGIEIVSGVSLADSLCSTTRMPGCAFTSTAYSPGTASRAPWSTTLSRGSIRRSVTLDPLLPANGPILRGLQLPAEYAITARGRARHRPVPRAPGGAVCAQA